MGRKKGREGRERERRKGHGGKEGISFLELCKTREEDHVSKWLRPSSLPERWDHIFFHGSNRFTPATLSHQTKKTRRRACLWSDSRSRCLTPQESPCVMWLTALLGSSTNALTLTRLYSRRLYASLTLRPDQWTAYNYDNDLATATSQERSKGPWNCLKEITFTTQTTSQSSNSRTGRYLYELAGYYFVGHHKPSGHSK